MWPGVKLESLAMDDGYTIYQVTVDLSEFDRIIFSNGGNRQTKDLVLTIDTLGFDANGNAYSF